MDKNHWVTKYKLSFSNDSVIWTYYKDANHLEPKVCGQLLFFINEGNVSSIIYQYSVMSTVSLTEF